PLPPPIPPLPTSTLDQLHALARKRWITFDHLARVYTGAGTIPYLGTIRILLDDLQLAHDNVKLRKRTMHLFTLGMNLSPVIDIPGPADYAAALLSLLQEYESWVNGSTKSRLLFITRRSTQGDDDYKYLRVRSIPFDLDYLQTFTTFLQLLT